MGHCKTQISTNTITTGSSKLLFLQNRLYRREVLSSRSVESCRLSSWSVASCRLSSRSVASCRLSSMSVASCRLSSRSVASCRLVPYSMDSTRLVSGHRKIQQFPELPILLHRQPASLRSHPSPKLEKLEELGEDFDIRQRKRIEGIS